MAQDRVQRSIVAGVEVGQDLEFLGDCQLVRKGL
jgi:hypothetical protein